MTFERLNENNVDDYIAYLKTAMHEEPDMMTAEKVDEQGIKSRISDPFFTKTTSVLAMKKGKVVGRIEYHFYGCMQDGYRMAYVDWVYVLKAHRHKGIAQMLFAELEKDCKKHNIDQYYLIRATNEAADRFYKNFQDAELNGAPSVRKDLNA
ncbi:MAG: GNAT family N-acetyltransferase [Acetatifactor sp.]|nr:GNAT family N-acetyltransferase [Acetatifactor sp.]